MSFDNSRDRELGCPSLILHREQGALTSCPNELWPQERLEALAAGRYPGAYLRERVYKNDPGPWKRPRMKRTAAVQGGPPHKFMAYLE